ncbi:MAG: cupin domain-containing protein [Phycisphaeraceae bacterium]|nr:cupin domain-containing protein [Phycisphaeraceae bacterium]
MNLVELAQRIRKLRIDRRMTLEDVCAAAGLTRSWLSKVENFRVTPSLPALAKIADTLGVHLSELLEGLDSKPQIVVVRKDERQKVLRDEQISNITYESLAYKRTGRRMDPFLLHLPPGATRVEPLAHEGEEFLLVIKGSTDFEYGDGNYELHEGDSLYFDASVPHRLVNRSESIVQVLCVFGELNNL